MKKLFVAILISVSIIGLAVTQMDITAQSGLKGTTVSLSTEFRGVSESVSQDRAKELYKAGQPLAFKSNGKLYFVINAGGNVDAKSLVRYAGSEYTISGSAKGAKGFNYIIASTYN